MTTFRNPLADPWEPVADPLWSADPSLKTAGIDNAVASLPRTKRDATSTILKYSDQGRFSATREKRNRSGITGCHGLRGSTRCCKGQ